VFIKHKAKQATNTSVCKDKTFKLYTEISVEIILKKRRKEPAGSAQKGNKATFEQHFNTRLIF
jgi:hypothetical protein